MSESEMHHFEIAMELEDLWARLKTQLSSFNPSQVIAMTTFEVESLRGPARDWLVEFMANETGKLSSIIYDGSCPDTSNRWLLGPNEVFEGNVTMVGNIVVYYPTVNQHVAPAPEPQNVIVVGTIGDLPQNGANAAQRRHEPSNELAIPRPPNAYILYRKDRQSGVKAMFPDFHNNDISVYLGQQWRAESIEVRKAYKEKADRIKEEMLKLYPDYKYKPRKPSEIRRRRKNTQSQDSDAASPASSASANSPEASGNLEASASLTFFASPHA